MCRPPFRHGSLFLYLFLQITFLTRCHYPSGPHVASLVAMRHQPRFLKLQKDWTEKGTAEEKVAAEGVVEKSWPERWLQQGSLERHNPRKEKKKKRTEGENRGFSWRVLKGREERENIKEKRGKERSGWTTLWERRRVFPRVLREGVWVELQ